MTVPAFFASRIRIGENIIDPNSQPFVIAEIGLNHNKDLEIAKRTIDAAQFCGASAVKFQSYTSDKFIHRAAPRVEGLYDIFAGLELDFDFMRELKKYADQKNLLLFSTPLTVDWVHHLAELQVEVFKIASGDVNNFQLLEAVVGYPQPVIISLGAAHLDEIRRLQGFLQLYNKKNVIFLHCVSMYPTPLEKCRLQNIEYYRENLAPLIGFSDHSSGSQAALAAAALGAVVIEKHFTLDHSLPGPDHSISADPDQFRQVVEAARLGQLMRGGDLLPAPWAEELVSDYYGKRSFYQTEEGLTAKRPRQQQLPKDSDYFSL